jgi:hypothetical protein
MQSSGENPVHGRSPGQFLVVSSAVSAEEDILRCKMILALQEKQGMQRSCSPKVSSTGACQVLLRHLQSTESTFASVHKLLKISHLETPISHESEPLNTSQIPQVPTSHSPCQATRL